MIVDNTLVFSDSQAITADAASTNIIDLGAAGTAYGHASAIRRDVGIGTHIPLFVSVTQTFDALTSMVIIMQTDDDVAFGSPKEVARSGSIVLASLVAGYKFVWPSLIPEGADERYIRLYYDITGTGPSVGKIFAGVVAARQTS